MAANLLKTAFRSILKNRTLSLFSIAGLAMAMAAAVLLLTYVHFETHFDTFHDGADRIYRIYSVYNNLDNEVQKVGLSMGRFAPAIAELPDVEAACRFFPVVNEIAADGKRYAETTAMAADAALFDIFDFHWLAGTAGAGFSDPGSAVVSRSLSVKLWGRIRADVPTVTFAGREFQVVGVFEDSPVNSEMRFDLIVSVNAFPFMLQQKSNEFHTFFKLTPRAVPAAALAAVDRVCKAILKSREVTGYIGSVRFQKLGDMHLNSGDIRYPVSGHGNRTLVLILAVIAGALILLAGLNFMYMQTAGVQLRLKEMAILPSLHKPFAELINPDFSAYSVVFPLAWKSLSALSLFLGLVVVFYPFVRVVRVLSSGRGAFTNIAAVRRRMLSATVFIQFTVVIILLASVLLIHRQLDYMLNTDLGFDGEGLILVDFRDGERYPVVRRELLQNPLITDVTASVLRPGLAQSGLSGRIEGGSFTGEIDLKADRVQDNYLDTYGIRVLAGRNFDPNKKDEDDGVLINQRAAEALGFSASEIVGRILDFDWGPKEVVGVFGNYHYSSLRTAVAPQVLCRGGKRMNFLTVRIRQDGAKEAVTSIRDTLRRISPGTLFNYSFLNDRLRRLYQDDRRARQLMAAAALLALILSSMGLLAMSIQAVNRRVREIGVRKILGAGRWEVTGLLLRDLCRGVLWANVVAVPVAWYGLGRWLSGFAYRVPLGPSLFIAAAAIALVIALLTVLTQTLYAASRNPADSLRCE